MVSTVFFSKSSEIRGVCEQIISESIMLLFMVSSSRCKHIVSFIEIQIFINFIREFVKTQTCWFEYFATNIGYTCCWFLMLSERAENLLITNITGRFGRVSLESLAGFHFVIWLIPILSFSCV